MDPEQFSVILKAISDSRNESTKAIGELSTAVAEFQGNIGARVTTLETDVASYKRWDHIRTALVPLYAIGHAVLAHFNIKA